MAIGGAQTRPVAALSDSNSEAGIESKEHPRVTNLDDRVKRERGGFGMSTVYSKWTKRSEQRDIN
jgi:hypothetical protein